MVVLFGRGETTAISCLIQAYLALVGTFVTAFFLTWLPAAATSLQGALHSVATVFGVHLSMEA